MTTVGSIGKTSVHGVAEVAPIAAQATVGVHSLPMPNVDAQQATGDVLALLYALTAKERDGSATQRANAAQRKSTERQEAMQHMQEELQRAKDAKDDGGWLGSVTKVIDGVTDAVVGGNPLQDLANSVADATGVDAVTIAYDFIRPDAILHAGVMLASAVTGEDKLAQGYDALASGSSLKTRFQAVADASGKQDEVMLAYSLTRDSIATAMVTVGTCGAGTAAYVAAGASALLMIEQRTDLLGRAGVEGEAKMWTRLGAQLGTMVLTAGLSYATGTVANSSGKAAVAIFDGTTRAARGGVQLGQAAYDKESQLHLAESAKYEGAQHRADREQERIVSGLRALARSYQQSLETIASTLNERDRTPLTLARQIA
jgi:hypothetical protein